MSVEEPTKRNSTAVHQTMPVRQIESLGRIAAGKASVQSWSDQKQAAGVHCQSEGPVVLYSAAPDLQAMQVSQIVGRMQVVQEVFAQN